MLHSTFCDLFLFENGGEIKVAHVVNIKLGFMD